MNNNDKNQLVTSIAQAVERLAAEHSRNPAFSFAKEADFWDVISAYTDFRCAGMPSNAAYSAVMLPEPIPEHVEPELVKANDTAVTVTQTNEEDDA